MVCNGVTHRRSVERIIFCIWYYVYPLSPLFKLFEFSPWFTAPSANKHVYKASPTTYREKRDRPISGGWDFSEIISSPDVFHQFPVHRANTSTCRVQLHRLSLPSHYHKLQDTKASFYPTAPAIHVCTTLVYMFVWQCPLHKLFIIWHRRSFHDTHDDLLLYAGRFTRSLT